MEGKTIQFNKEELNLIRDALICRKYGKQEAIRKVIAYPTSYIDNLDRLRREVDLIDEVLIKL